MADLRENLESPRSHNVPDLQRILSSTSVPTSISSESAVFDQSPFGNTVACVDIPSAMGAARAVAIHARAMSRNGRRIVETDRLLER